MKTLVVAPVAPWPEASGAQIRLANVVRALSTLGDVDLILLAVQGQEPCGLAPSTLPVRRSAVVGLHTRGRRLRTAWWLLAGRWPLEVVERPARPARRAFRALEAGEYDLAWFSRIPAYVALGAVVRAPAVVDFDDLEDRKAEGRLALLRDAGSGAKPALEGRGRLVRLYARTNAARWRRAQARVAGAADAVAVCSHLDRQRLGAPNAVVVPNGYTAPARPLGRVTVGRPPTLLLQGLLYGSRGRIALTFPGTKSDNRSDKNRPWNAYVVISTNALAADPLFLSTTGNPLSDPIHRGDCQNRCAGMFDFLDVIVSPHDGAMWATATDTCTTQNSCINSSAAGNSPSGRGVASDADGVAIRQVSGPRIDLLGCRDRVSRRCVVGGT